jgi:ApbE superfamily uncharacterized protein (UPF0280 family)
MPFLTFRHLEAKFRIRTTNFHACNETIVAQRALLDEYIAKHPDFKTAMAPVHLDRTAPDVVVRMQIAAAAVGVGPMAAVAGLFAELAAHAAVDSGAEEAIVENGGDIFIISPEEVTLGIFAGESPLSGKLALRIPPTMNPIAICSSSSTMGHSTSMGDCDLATVFADDGALADAAATQAANLVSKQEDIQPTLEKIGAIAGVRGLLIIKGDQIGIEGDLPQLIRCNDNGLASKITRHQGALLPTIVV